MTSLSSQPAIAAQANLAAHPIDIVASRLEVTKLCDLSGIVGIDRNYIGRILRGTSAPSPEIVEALAEALQVTTTELVAYLLSPREDRKGLRKSRVNTAQRKLPTEQVLDVRRRYDAGESCRKIGAWHEVSAQTVVNIGRRYHYGDVPEISSGGGD